MISDPESKQKRATSWAIYQRVSRIFPQSMGQIFPVPIILNNSKSNKRAIFNRFWDPRDL